MTTSITWTKVSGGNSESSRRLRKPIAACRDLVEKSLRNDYALGMTAERLFKRYMMFGDDPFIVVTDGSPEGVIFSAWEYAKERCSILCANPPGGGLPETSSAG